MIKNDEFNKLLLFELDNNKKTWQLRKKKP
jgi:hypothetical protein